MKNNRGVLQISLLLLFAFFLLSKNVIAQELSIVAYPATQELDVKENEASRTLLQFRNNAENPISGTVRVGTFIVSDKDGTPTLIEDPAESVKYSAASWIVPDQTRITIPPKDYVPINLTITVPEDAKTCGKYALVYFDYESDQPVIEGVAPRSSVSAINTKIGALISLNVETQECKKALSISQFMVPSFIENGPIPVSFEILNSGDVHITPMGAITVKSLFNSVVAKKDIPEKRVFPESIRAYKEMVGSQWMFGRYAVELSVKAAETGTPVSVIAYSWIIPWRLILILVLLLAIVFIIISRFKKGITQKEEKLEEELKKEHKEIAELKEMLEKKQE